MIQPRSKLFYGVLMTVGVLLLLLLAVGFVAAQGSGTRIEFKAISVVCIDGETIDILDEPLPIYEGTSTFEATITDKGEIFVETVQFPTAYPGSTWVAPGRGRLTPNGFIVHHRGYGTGEFEGGKIFYKATPPDEPLENPPCELDPDAPVAQLVGNIILPPGLVE